MNPLTQASYATSLSKQQLASEHDLRELVSGITFFLNPKLEHCSDEQVIEHVIRLSNLVHLHHKDETARRIFSDASYYEALVLMHDRCMHIIENVQISKERRFDMTVAMLELPSNNQGSFAEPLENYSGSFDFPGTCKSELIEIAIKNFLPPPPTSRPSNIIQFLHEAVSSRFQSVEILENIFEVCEWHSDLSIGSVRRALQAISKLHSLFQDRSGTAVDCNSSDIIKQLAAKVQRATPTTTADAENLLKSLIALGLLGHGTPSLFTQVLTKLAPMLEQVDVSLLCKLARSLVNFPNLPKSIFVDLAAALKVHDPKTVSAKEFYQLTYAYGNTYLPIPGFPEWMGQVASYVANHVEDRDIQSCLSFFAKYLHRPADPALNVFADRARSALLLSSLWKSLNSNQQHEAIVSTITLYTPSLSEALDVARSLAILDLKMARNYFQTFEDCSNLFAAPRNLDRIRQHQLEVGLGLVGIAQTPSQLWASIQGSPGFTSPPILDADHVIKTALLGLADQQKISSLDYNFLSVGFTPCSRFKYKGHNFTVYSRLTPKITTSSGDNTKELCDSIRRKDFPGFISFQDRILRNNGYITIALDLADIASFASGALEKHIIRLADQALS